MVTQVHGPRRKQGALAPLSLSQEAGFLFGVVYTKPDTYPMTVQLNNIVNSVQGVKEYNVNMAATILTGLVPLIVYFVSGKLFVRGIAAGAVKG